VGPDGHFRGSFCPVASTLMFVPPMSMTRTLRPLECFILFATDSLPRKTASSVRGSRRHSCDKLKAELPAIILFRRGGRTPCYIPLSVWAVKEYWMKRPTRCVVTRARCIPPLTVSALAWPPRNRSAISEIGLWRHTSPSTGLTMDVPPRETWRGILAVRQSSGSFTPAVKFGALVREARDLPVTEGKHTIAVRCGGVWSDDFIFYREGDLFFFLFPVQAYGRT